jgi:signal peptidase II
MKPRLVFAVLVVVTLGMDQGTKGWARGLSPGRHSVIAGLWDWEPAQNPGAAFSTFPGGTMLLSLIAAAAIIAVTVAAIRTPAEQRWRLAGFALIAGGALGNLIDRVRLGSVTDFVRWRFHDHLWPIFNVADAALVLGVVLLLAQRPAPRRLPA